VVSGSADVWIEANYIGDKLEIQSFIKRVCSGIRYTFGTLSLNISSQNMCLCFICRTHGVNKPTETIPFKKQENAKNWQDEL
jgi:hypothetical protein